MSTAVVTNRISTHGPAEVAARGKYKKHKCTYKDCDKAFTSPQALAMHVGRKHTHTITNASREAIQAGLAKARVGTVEQRQGVLKQLLEQYPNGRGGANFAQGMEAHPEWAKVCGWNTPKGKSRTYATAAYMAKRSNGAPKARRKFAGLAVTEVPKSECVITGPGLRIEFGPALLPTLLHTIALSLGKQGRH